MDIGVSFGTWLKRRRKSLDLTQDLLSQRVYCSLATIQKIEADERRPSQHLAELLANALEIPDHDRPLFLKVARGDRAADQLANVSLPAEWSLLQTIDSLTRPKNLPVSPTPLIGREAELTELSGLIVKPDCHLLTIIGPGGVGKTQLALAVAAACGDVFTHGVCFVPLAPLTTSEFIVPAIAHALNFSTSGPAEPKTQLLNYLHEKELLLVVDNLEHLLSDISVLAEILRSAPGVKLLATSRERLNLQDEWVFDLHSLPTPTIGQTAELEKNSAVKLFLHAAQRQRFGFTLTEQNRKDVARICRLVDGMPLGLELAAAWTHVLSCQEIANEIEGSLDFLIVSARDRPERHRSLRAVFDHSWRLLTVEEQRALRQLSVFRGSFGREAAERVAGATLPILSALTNKSLVHRTSASRYDLHELIRQYCALKLNEANEETEIRQRHFDYFLSLSEMAAPHLTTAERKPWLDRLEVEHDNLQTALGWSQIQTGNGEAMLRLAGALYWFWSYRGDLKEGRSWLESALRRADDPVSPFIRARALYGAGCMAYSQGDNALAYSLLEESVALWRGSGVSGKQGLAHGLSELGSLTRDKGDLVLARSLCAESVALFREQGDRWGLAYALINMGMVLRDESNFTEARSLMEMSITLWRELEDTWGLAHALHCFALVALRQGDYHAARSRCEEALNLRQGLGDRHGVAYSLHNLGLIALNQDNIERAKPYFQQCQALFDELGDKFGIANAFQYHGYLALLEGDDGQAQLFFEQGLELAREAGPKFLSALYLARIAGVAAVRGRAIQAITLWEAAEVLMAASSSYMDSADRIYYERTIDPACVGLDKEAIEAARAEGRAMSLEQAISYALKIIHSEP